MVTESKYSLTKKRERKDSTRRAELFLLGSILFHVALLAVFSLLTIEAAMPDKPLVVDLADDRDNEHYEFNDFPQDNQTDKEVDSHRLSDKNREVERETIRKGSPLGGGTSRRPGAVLTPPSQPDRPEKNTDKNKTPTEDTLVAKKETGSELAKKKDESTPRTTRERLSMDDLLPNGDDVARLDQPLGTSAPGITEEESVSLNTTEFKYYAYFAHIKRQIELAWSYPSKAQEKHEAGRLTIVFTIESGGNVSSIKLLKSSGYPILDDYAMNAVRIASPFNPIPASIGTKRLRITANFEYILSMYGGR